MGQLLSRETLKAVYINHTRSRHAWRFEEKCWRYRVTAALRFSEMKNAYEPAALAISAQNDSEPRSGSIAFGQERDYRHFGEFVYLLAAKLKYDRLHDTPTERAGFLHSEEIRRLYKANATEVPPTVYATMHRLYNNAKGGRRGESKFLGACPSN